MEQEGETVAEDTKEAVQKEIDHIKSKNPSVSLLDVKCFGNFEVYIDGKPVVSTANHVHKSVVLMKRELNGDCCYIAINFAIGNGIEPIFLGKQFGIATSVVIFSVLFWGWVWGPCGMLLAVPITVMIKLALENSRDLHWVATIIDDNATPSAKDKKAKQI